jgi:hypothetical protein
VLVLALVALAMLAIAFRPVVEGDGVGYFAYLHTLLVDQNVDLTHSYAAATAAGVNTDPPALEAPTRTGHRADYFPMGAAVLSVPAYVVALLLGSPAQPEYSPLLAGAFVLSSLLCGLFALLLCWLLTRSLVAVAAAALCTPYLYYLLYEPGYSHTFSAFAVSLFVLAWWRGREERSAAGWLWLGALVGLMALTRWQDALFGAIALLDVIQRPRWRALLLLPGAAAVLAPQLVVNDMIFASPLPQRPPGQAIGLLGHQLQVLLSSWHGLFVWHPLTLAAAAGFLFVRDRTLRIACVYALVVQTAVNGAVPDWWGGAAFGARRFVDLLPFWAIGLAALAERVPRVLAWTVTSLGAAWNVVLIANFLYVMRGDHDPGYLGLLAGQLAAVRYVPHLVQGAVVRELLIARWLARPPDTALGLAWLAIEAACVGLAAAAALAAGRGYTLGSTFGPNRGSAVTSESM